MTKVGYMGPAGTFSQEALNSYINGRESEYEVYTYNNIADTIYAVCQDKIDEAVVPIENSLEGAINLTMDTLAEEADLKIKGELVIKVCQNLLVKEGTNPSDIRCIVSHPQAIGQCRKYIETKFPKATVITSHSTVEAIMKVAAGDGTLAAIGSAAAAGVYGLAVVDAEIHDEDNNLTRFVILAKNDAERTGNDKTSIVFSTENTPGSLYGVLDIFNLWDINMMRIESRPAKKQLGRYIFFVDIKGHREDQDVRDALTMVQRKTSFFKLIGSYKEDDTLIV